MFLAFATPLFLNPFVVAAAVVAAVGGAVWAIFKKKKP